jgi:hypothetical protein
MDGATAVPYYPISPCKFNLTLRLVPKSKLDLFFFHYGYFNFMLYSWPQLKIALNRISGFIAFKIWILTAFNTGLTVFIFYLLTLCRVQFYVFLCCQWAKCLLVSYAATWSTMIPMTQSSILMACRPSDHERPKCIMAGNVDSKSLLTVSDWWRFLMTF